LNFPTKKRSQPIGKLVIYVAEKRTHSVFAQDAAN